MKNMKNVIEKNLNLGFTLVLYYGTLAINDMMSCLFLFPSSPEKYTLNALGISYVYIDDSQEFIPYTHILKLRMIKKI